MPRDFTHGRFPPRKINKNTVGGKMPLGGRIVGTVFLLFWMAMPTRALVEMLSKEKLASLREAPFPAVIMILILSIFPIAGLAGLFSLWRGRLPVGRSSEESPPTAETPPAPPPMTEADAPRRQLSLANCILPLFGLVFLLAGGFVASIQIRRILDQPAGTTEYALLLFPIPFILFGLVALFFGVRILLPPRTSESFDTPLTGLKLKRTGGESGAKILFTCMWCVFSFVFTTIWFTSSDGFSWTKDFWTFDKFFVLIFPLVGIGFIISCVRDAIRRALTGRYEVEIVCDRLRPGARVQVTYKFNGDTSRLRHVVFSLTQQSMAMQRSTGTMRMSGGSPMESKDVVCTIDDPMRAQYGTFTMTIPAAIDSPRIVWRLVVKYAGITDTFRLDVG